MLCPPPPSSWALFCPPGLLTLATHIPAGSSGTGLVAVQALEPRSGQQMAQWIHDVHTSSPEGSTSHDSSSDVPVGKQYPCCVLRKAEADRGHGCEAVNLSTSNHMWLEEDEGLAQQAQAWREKAEQVNTAEDKLALRTLPTVSTSDMKSMYFSRDSSVSADKGAVPKSESAPILKSRQRRSKTSASSAGKGATEVVHAASAPEATSTSKPKSGRKRKSTNRGPFIDSIKVTPRLSSEVFFDQGVHDLSKALLGRLLVSEGEDGQRASGIIVETEAYPGGEDKASHSAGGKRTPRNEPMYMAPGTSYVYFIYGYLNCFNISSRG